MSCTHCDYEGKPLRGQERVTSRPVWMCTECRGRLPRPSDRGKKPRNNRRKP